MEVAGGSRSGGEIVQLWSYLDNRLNKRVRPTMMMPRSGLIAMPPTEKAGGRAAGQDAS